MKKTKTFFESTEMSKLATIVSDCAQALAARGVVIDDSRREEITRCVLDIASRGITDPEEIRELTLAHLAK